VNLYRVHLKNPLLGSQILYALKLIYKNLFLLLFAFVFFTCKKEKPLDSQFVGTWETVALTFDGVDTTAFLKRDTNCYGYIRFLIDDGSYYLHIDPAKGNFNGFYCGQMGYWYKLGKRMEIEFFSESQNTVGPYLVAQKVWWDLIENSENSMSLSINWNGSNVSWKLKKIY